MANQSVTGLPEKLGDGVYVGTFANQSPEWHEQRAKGIGGSDVGVICGLSQWSSAYTWAAKRLGAIEDTFEPNEAMFWGTTLETVILDVWGNDHPELKLHREVGTWAHHARDWQQANPDAIYETSDDEGGKTFGIVEIKTSRYEDDWKKGKDGEPDQVPATYRAQVLWYLQTFGFSHAYVVVLFSGNKLRTFEIRYDKFEAETNLSIVEEFKTFIDREELPPFSAPYNSTFETVRFMHPEIDDSEVELGTLGLTYFAALRQLEKAQEEFDLCKSHVAAAMGTAKRGTIDGVLAVTRQARGTGVPYLVTKKQK